MYTNNPGSLSGLNERGAYMDTKLTVAGTTFHPIPEGVGLKVKDEGMDNGVPIAYIDAVLVPEPTNEYDPDAVQVFVPLKTDEPFVIGYIPKHAPVKTQITGPTLAKICIKDYRMVGNFNPSFVIEEIKLGNE